MAEGFSCLSTLEAKAREETGKRLVEVPQPFLDFNPLTASDETLARYGIVPRPHEADNPVLLSLWQRALSPPVRIKAVHLKDLIFDTSYRLARPDAVTQLQMGAAASRYGASNNWSGAFIVAERARRFTWVGGQWKVPTPIPPLNKAGELDDGDYRVATWIGLDGNYRRSESLPQAGTTQTIVVTGGVAAAPIYSVWFQWWTRNQAYPVKTFDPALFPVEAGDEMDCLLAVDAGSATVNITITNHTQAWAAPIKYAAPNDAGLIAVGSTAEWVVERPQSFIPPCDFYQLPDYGHVCFTHCTTAAAHDPPSDKNPGSLLDARRIRMRLDVAGPPHRSAIISHPEKLGLHSLRTSYRSPF